MEITKNCYICGDSELYLIPKVGGYQVKCVGCDKIIENVKIEKYKTLVTNCNKCGSEKFKANLTEKENNGHLKLGCANCKTQPAIIYVDKDLYEIDRKAREILILNDTLEEVILKIKKLEDQLIDTQW